MDIVRCTGCKSLVVAYISEPVTSKWCSRYRRPISSIRTCKGLEDIKYRNKEP